MEYLDPESINGLNLYCYCYNNPVNYYDPTGHFMISTSVLIGAIIGVVVGGAIGYGVGYLARGTYANDLVEKSVGGGVKSFLSQANKVHHVLGQSKHKLVGYTTKTMGKLMKKTLAKGVVSAYGKAQSAYRAIAGSEVTFVVIDGVIKISDMWIR